MSKIELTVIKKFKDKNDTTVSFDPGSKLNIDEIARINDLVKRGLCEITSLDVTDENIDTINFGEKEYDIKTMISALKQIEGINVAPNAGIKSITDKLTTLNDDQKTTLSELLNKE